MHNDKDLETVVTAEALTPEFTAPLADEESAQPRTGFNDVAVVLATVLVMIAVVQTGAWASGALEAGLLAAVGWGLSEYFTRHRHMPMLSALLVFGFAGAAYAGVDSLLRYFAGTSYDGRQMSSHVVGMGVTALAVYLHWRRFRVPISVAVSVGALRASRSAFWQACFLKKRRIP